jgi:arginyl-tRNA synthetase
MSAAVRDHLVLLLTQALARVAPNEAPRVIALERPKQAAHGDYACNAALQIAKGLKQPPRQVAERLVAALPASDWLEAAEIAGPGFINLRLKPAAKQAVIASIFAAGEGFGHVDRARGAQVMVEFVSANPTGPLHVGHGRQAALGDAICNLLATQGFRVTREFYYNDAGVQIANLGRSVQARARQARGEDVPFPEDGYHGDYIGEIAAAFLAAGGDPADLDGATRFAVQALRAEQDTDLQALGVRFDNYYLESSLYTDGRVASTVAALVASGHTYEADGALWLRTTEYGDDKDRVMRKSDGAYTYFVPDVAYHVTKWQRGFVRAINVQGSDHHSTVVRVRAGLQALGLGIPKGYPDYVLHKMVRVLRGGEEVKISKRAGSYVTVRDLIDDVGRDAVRFFLASRKADTEFTFDLDLAKSQSEDNPVYYVQYAHARVCSVLAAWSEKFGEEARATTLERVALAPLTGPREQELMQRLGDYGDVLEQAAEEFAPHQIAFYLRELAGAFHSYYNAERFLVEDRDTRLARLALAQAVRRVLANGLALLGVGAPSSM